MAAAALLTLGVISVSSDQNFVASDNAVVSTRLISLRAPIEGIAAANDAGAGAGALVKQGQTIVHIANPLFNDESVVTMRETLKRLVAERNNAEADRTALTALAVDLKARAAIHAKANATRLAGLEAEGRKALGALVARQQQAQYDIDHRAPLEARGIVSEAEGRRLQTARDSTEHDVEAQQAHIESLRAETEAANSGVLSGPGGIDVPIPRSAPIRSRSRSRI